MPNIHANSAYQKGQNSLHKYSMSEKVEMNLKGDQNYERLLWKCCKCSKQDMESHPLFCSHLSKYQILMMIKICALTFKRLSNGDAKMIKTFWLIKATPGVNILHFRGKLFPVKIGIFDLTFPYLLTKSVKMTNFSPLNNGE